MTDVSTPTDAEPLPCPFCGSKAQHRCQNLGDHAAYADLVSYTCTGCGAYVSAVGDASKGGYADNSTVEARALAAWNRRAPTTRGPVACSACRGSGWTVRDPDVGTDQKCFVCDGSGLNT